MKIRTSMVLVSALLIFIMVSGPFLAIAAPVNHSEPAMLGGPASTIIPVVDSEAVVSNAPTTNYHSNANRGGLFIGYEPIDGMTRSWFKFDMANLPKEIGVTGAFLRVYLNDEYVTDDLPIAAHYSTNDTWDETKITWSNQPDYQAAQLDIIDSPASPNMFLIGNWYAWDVTSAFMNAMNDDKVLSIVLKQDDEGLTSESWKYFLDEDFNATAPFYGPQIEVMYTTPDAAGLQVDGVSSPPLVDYIQDPTPTLEWTMTDSGTGEYQRDYEVEVWNNEGYNDTMLWQEKHTESPILIHDAAGNLNSRPFGTDQEFRYQMKFPSSLFFGSGVVDKISFEVSDATGLMEFEDLQIFMLCVEDTGDLTSDYQANYDGREPIMVLNRPYVSAEVQDNWFTIDIENSFFLSKSLYLIIELRFMDNIGLLSTTPVTYAASGSVAYTYGVGASMSLTAAITSDRLHSLSVQFESDMIHDPGTAVSNSFPFGTDIGDPGIFQTKYNASMIEDTGFIDKLWFPVSHVSENVTYENLVIRMAESPVLGALSHTDFESNFGGVTPVTVLDRAVYTIRNLGKALVIDLDNLFYYSGTHDLLIDMRWGNLTSGHCSVYRDLDAGAYRAWDLTMSSTPTTGNDTRTTHLYVDFVHSETDIEYAGTALTNATRYYWRVKTCDSMGIWSDWTSSSFKYEELSSTPGFTTPVVDPTPCVVNTEVTVSLNVTYFLGIHAVSIEIDGSNYTMSQDGDTFSYDMIPATAGNITFTIYMESNIGTWSTTSGLIQVVQGGGLPGDMTMWLVIGAAGVIIVVIIVILMKRPKK